MKQYLCCFFTIVTISLHVSPQKYNIVHLNTFKLHSKKNAFWGEQLLEQITYVSKINLLHTEYPV